MTNDKDSLVAHLNDAESAKAAANAAIEAAARAAAKAKSLAVLLGVGATLFVVLAFVAANLGNAESDIYFGTCMMIAIALAWGARRSLRENRRSKDEIEAEKAKLAVAIHLVETNLARLKAGAVNPQAAPAPNAVANSSAPSRPSAGALDVSAATNKNCPMCAEEVKSAAKICRFCGHEFVE